MKSKKIYIIFLIIAVSIIIFSYMIFKITNNKKEIQVATESEKTEEMIENYNIILKSENAKVCNVNQQEITNKDIILTKIFNKKTNEEEAKEKTIEDTVVLQEINKKEIKLNENDSNYVDEIVKGLKSNSEFDSSYSEKEKKEILSDIHQKLYNDALINQYKSQIIKEISSKTFIPQNENINNQYQEYLKIQEKWDNKKGISYKKLQDARDKFIEFYIADLRSRTVVK